MVFTETKFVRIKETKIKKDNIFAVFMVQVNVNLLNWLIVYVELYVTAIYVHK
jgi:hypothetical protein